MDKYFCVFQLPADLTPMRVTFEAEHPGKAILKMMELAKISNTIELEQAEILKCVRSEDGKVAYLPVFLKEKSADKGKVILKNTLPALPVPVIEPAVIEKQEDVYKKPYTVEVM